MKRYYLPFEPRAKQVNYFFLFELIDIAEYNINTQAFDKIHYISIQKLADSLSFSSATLNRMISNDSNNEYKLFLSVDRKAKTIVLNTCFSNRIRYNKQPFIVLTENEVQLLRTNNDNLFCRYLMYLKYYCGYSKSKTTDFTANQFLSACGYSINSNSNKNNLSIYNSVLIKNNFIKIDRFIDELGHLRNRYTYLI